MHRPPLDHSPPPSRGGGWSHGVASPLPNPGSPPAIAGESLWEWHRYLEPLFVLFKKKTVSGRRDAAPASGPSISSFLQRLSPYSESHSDVFPGCFSVSAVTFGKERSTLGCGGPRLDPVGVVRRSDTVDRLSLLFILLSFLLKTPRSPALSVLMVWLGWQYLPCRIVDVVVVVVVYFRYPLYIWNEDQSM